MPQRPPRTWRLPGATEQSCPPTLGAGKHSGSTADRLHHLDPLDQPNVGHHEGRRGPPIRCRCRRHRVPKGQPRDRWQSKRRTTTRCPPRTSTLAGRIFSSKGCNPSFVLHVIVVRQVIGGWFDVRHIGKTFRRIRF